MNEKNVFLRNATEEDINLLFDWVNDPVTRQSAFDSHTITYQEHQSWYKKILEDPNQMQLILMENGEAVGQIRISIEEENAIIDYSISSKKRGQGLGTAILEMVKSEVKIRYPLVKRLIGNVRKTNIASINCFKNSGFVENYIQFKYEY